MIFINDLPIHVNAKCFKTQMITRSLEPMPLHCNSNLLDINLDKCKILSLKGTCNTNLSNQLLDHPDKEKGL